MKRRRFLKGIAAAPAAPALLAQQAAAPANPLANPPVRGGRGVRAGARGSQEVSKIETTAPDIVSEPVVRFFNPQQFATLQKLSGILVPPIKGNPGALDCGVPEFLDFLIGVSPTDRQRLYRTGLPSGARQQERRIAPITR